MTITVSTDGSALANPNGPMGWAWADHEHPQTPNSEHQHTSDSNAGGATNGTNQIGELCAVLEALRTHPGNEELVIETDSQYAINCSTKWVHGWKKNGWKNSKKEPVKNAELIKAIDAELSKRSGKVRFVWVKGHAGNAGNEKVDELARGYATSCRNHTKEGYLPKEGWQSLLNSEYTEGVDVPGSATELLEGALSNQDYRAQHSSGSSAEIHENGTQQGTVNSDTDKQNVDDSLAKTSILPLHTSPQNPANSSAQSGLSVSGTLQFTPPPSSSPSYDGNLRLIRGHIYVEGYVQGDGTIVLENAPFHVNRVHP